MIITGDTVVLANMTPNMEPDYKKREVYRIGDAVVTCRANGAVHDGYRLGMTF